MSPSPAIESGDLVIWFPGVTSNTPPPTGGITAGYVIRPATPDENAAILAALPWTPIAEQAGPYFFVWDNLAEVFNGETPLTVSVGAVVSVIKGVADRSAIAALWPGE